MSDVPDKPSEQAILMAYQVTARVCLSEGNLIWTRTKMYLLVYGAFAAFLQYSTNGSHYVLPLVIALGGCLYTVFWYASMRRMWDYYELYLGLMREHEDALKLGKLGLSLRGKEVFGEGNKKVGDTQFSPHSLGKAFNAKCAVNSVMLIFFALYFYYFIRYLP